MSSFESEPDFERLAEELLQGVPGNFEAEMQAMESIGMGGTASVQQEYNNARELIQYSRGIRLSTFAFGADLVVTTGQTLGGAEGHLRMTLVPWAGQTKIEPGEAVRAFVSESNIPGITPETEIQINGPSIGSVTLDNTHNGEIREQCNLMVTPMSFVEACKTDLAPEKFEDMIKDGVIELADRGPFKGRYIMPNVWHAPVVLPEVVRLDRVHPDHGALERQQWLAPRALES